MRIYLACTVRGDRGTLAAVRHIHQRLRDMGHEVLTAHLLADDVERAESVLGDGDVFRRDLEWLNAADAVVAEASGSSYGVGFEVGYILGRAAQTGQRALVMYEAGRRGAVSRLISGLSHDRASVLGYASVAEIDTFLDAHLPRA